MGGGFWEGEACRLVFRKGRHSACLFLDAAASTMRSSPVREEERRMPYHRCMKCGTTEESGAFFRRCNDCGAEYCNSCSHDGMRCPECSRGFLHKA
jgi:DNA-directed RNA polymerase subunit RPC12/RpoP